MENILDIICCPNCQGDLEEIKSGKKIKEQTEETKVIKEKEFVCTKCKSEFREKEGIFILINKDLEEKLHYG